MPEPPPAPQTWQHRLEELFARVLGALISGALAGLLLLVAYKAQVSPIEIGHGVAILALRMFALLTVGTLGLGLALFALVTVFPGLGRYLEQDSPEAVRSRCPGCGGLLAKGCECGELASTPWVEEQTSSRADLAAFPFMTGVGFLGLFMIAQSGAEDGLLYLLAGKLLGLLVLVVGFGVGLFVLVEVAKGRPRNERVFNAYRVLEREDVGYQGTLRAQITTRGRRVRAASGEVSAAEPWDEAPEVQAPTLDVVRAARYLAAASLLGAIHVIPRRVRRWKLDPDALAADPSQGAYRAGVAEPVTTHEQREVVLSRTEREVARLSPWHEALLNDLSASRTLGALLEGLPGRPDLLERIQAASLPEGPDEAQIDRRARQMLAAL